LDVAISVNNVPIRLTGERWRHITGEHNDLAGYYYDGFVISAYFTSKIDRRKIIWQSNWEAPYQQKQKRYT